MVNEDLRAVNGQINVIFNLLADNLTNYEDVDIEDVDSITTGKTGNCTNRGIIKGDINVGGIAGSMSIDEEDPEDSAAGGLVSAGILVVLVRKVKAGRKKHNNRK